MTDLLEDHLKTAREALTLGRLSDAASAIAEARKVAQDSIDSARVIDLFGAVLAQKQDLPMALRHHLQAAALCREKPEQWDGQVAALGPAPAPDLDSAEAILEARYLANAGALAQITDKPGIAESALTRALSLLEQSDDKALRPLKAEASHNLGVLLSKLGRLNDALPFLEQAVVLDRAQLQENPNLMARRLLHGDLLILAAALKDQNPKRATEIAQESHDIAQDLGVVAQARSLLTSAHLQFAQGERLAAMEQTRAAIDLLESIPEPSPQLSEQLGRAYIDLATYARLLDHKAAAIESLNRAAEHANHADSPALKAMVVRERALVLQPKKSDEG